MSVKISRNLALLAATAAFLVIGAGAAHASTITFTVTGTIDYSNGTAIDPLDPVLTDPNNFNLSLNDPWTLMLTFGTGDYTAVSPGNFTLTSGTAMLTIDNSANEVGEIYSFDYDASNYIGFSTTGSAPALSVCMSSFCESAVPNLVNYSLLLDFTGSLGSPDDLPAVQLTAGTSPSFDFMRNFSDGGETELMGDVSSASAVEQAPITTPEPPTLWLLAGGLLALGLFRKHSHTENGDMQ